MERGLATGDKDKRDGGVKPPLQKARVLSGMRPTGRMHIGNYFGALANWVRLQNELLPTSGVGSQGPAGRGAPSSSSDSPLATRHSPLPLYECFYFIADWHSLTSDYADTSAIAQNVIEIATDYLAGGLHPDKSVLFLQSLVPEHAELHLLLSMVTPLGWLERVPTYKEALENIKDKDLHNYGFLGYPVLQCGDIVMYGEPGVPLWVPVGEDQVSHVETSREIVRRFDNFFAWKLDRQKVLDASVNGPDWVAASIFFNYLSNYNQPEPKWGPESASPQVVDYMEASFEKTRMQIGMAELLKSKSAWKNLFRPVLTEPEVMLTKTPKVPGLDGRKMSKSYGNTITLSESDADIRAKTKVMVTDPARKRRTDPGNPDVCPVYDWHKLFAPKKEAGEYTAEGKATLEWVWQGCTTAGIGCIECKAKMADHLIQWITPIRERRVEYEKHPAHVLEVLDEGSKRARKVAQATMERVREAVFGWEKKRKEIEGSGKKVASG